MPKRRLRRRRACGGIEREQVDRWSRSPIAESHAAAVGASSTKTGSDQDDLPLPDSPMTPSTSPRIRLEVHVGTATTVPQCGQTLVPASGPVDSIQQRCSRCRAACDQAGRTSSIASVRAHGPPSRLLAALRVPAAIQAVAGVGTLVSLVPVLVDQLVQEAVGGAATRAGEAQCRLRGR